jgi:RNA polymerase sigma-70 factor, ECF subfamily
VRDRRTRGVSASHFTSPTPKPRLRMVESGPTDRDELLHRVSLGDRDAFTALYDELSPQVYGLVRRVVCDPAQSEEVTQEVFVEVWRIAHRFDPNRGAASTWVLTIAHRRAVDRVRSEQTQRDRVQALGQVPLLGPADDMASSLDRQVVRDAMNGLTELQRQSIELAYFRGLTQGQIAELLDVPLGTIKTRIRDGLIRLRDALGEGS